MDISDLHLKTTLIHLFKEKWMLTLNSIKQNLHLKNDDGIKLLQETLQQLVNDNQIGMKVAKNSSNKKQSIYYWKKGTIENVNYPSPHNYKRSINNVGNSSKKRRSIGLAPGNRRSFCSPLLKRSPRQGSIDTDDSSTLQPQDHQIAAASHVVETPKKDKENLPISKHELHDLIDSKAKLVQVVQEKENKLRKLKLVKMYHSKINLNNLDQLIAKWRNISQDVAQQLLDKIQVEPRPTMAQLLDAYHIDLDLIQYSIEDEAFFGK